MGTPDPNQPNPGSIKRAMNILIGHPLLVALLVTGLGTAAITITYLNDSTMTADAIEAPIQFEEGDDTTTTASDYVNTFTISSDATYFTASINGVPEANLTIESFVKIKNTDDSNSHDVTLTTSQVSSAEVDDYTLIILDTDSNTLDVLDFTAASPSATATLPASTTYEVRLHLELASGATLTGGLERDITLSVG